MSRVILCLEVKEFHRSYLHFCEVVSEVYFWTVTYQIGSIFKQIYLTPIDGTLSAPTTPGQSGSVSNGNEEVLYTPQIYRTEASPSDAGHAILGRSYPPAEDTVKIFKVSLTGI